MTLALPGSGRFSRALLGVCALAGCARAPNPCDALAGRWVGERTETPGVTTLPDPAIGALVRAMRWEFSAGSLVTGTEQSPGHPEATRALSQEGARCRLEVGREGTRTHRTLVAELQGDGRLRIETEGRGVALFLRRP